MESKHQIFYRTLFLEMIALVFAFSVCWEVSGKNPDNSTADGIHVLPEWEANSALMVAWTDHDILMMEILKAASHAGECWIFTNSWEDAFEVEEILSRENVFRDHINCLEIPVDDVWIADYGPVVRSKNGDLELLDFDYGNPNDDQFPAALARELGVNSVPVDLAFEGGNLMTDGQGTCFTTDQIYDQGDRRLSRKAVEDTLKSKLGCDKLIVLNQLKDGTGHIDMFAKIINANTILLGEYKRHSPEFRTLEKNYKILSSVNSVSGNRYNILRIPMPEPVSEYRTYTNSVIFNDIVIVPQYQCEEDERALSVYRESLPNHQVIGLNCREIIRWGGAVHCTSKIVPSSLFCGKKAVEKDRERHSGKKVNLDSIPSLNGAKDGLEYWFYPENPPRNGDTLQFELSIENHTDTVAHNLNLVVVFYFQNHAVFAPSYRSFDAMGFDLLAGFNEFQLCEPVTWTNGYLANEPVYAQAFIFSPEFDFLIHYSDVKKFFE